MKAKYKWYQMGVNATVDCDILTVERGVYEHTYEIRFYDDNIDKIVTRWVSGDEVELTE